MTTAETIPETIEAPKEALTPREQRLERAAGVLRWGAIVSGGLVVVLLAAALLGGVGLIPGLFPTLQNLLLGRAPLAADAALSVVILLLLVDINLLLVLMVGVLAREFWSIPAVWLVAAVNVGAVILFGFT